MDSDLCYSYSWVSSIGISDAEFWESVFPCKDEFETAHKKRRLINEDAEVQYEEKTNVPQYSDLTNSYTTSKVESSTCSYFKNAVEQTTFEREPENKHDSSHTWEDFFKYMECQEPELVTEPFVFKAPTTISKERQNVGKDTPSRMVVVGADVRYSCHLCSKTFRTNRGLKLHVHSHRSDKKNMQSVLKASSPKSESNHKYNHHRTAIKPHACPLCDRGFKIRQDLQVHVVTGACTRADRFLRRVTKGWECTSCDKLFDDRNRAECHTRTHTYGHRVNCPVCHMDFTGCKGNILVRHVKELHPGYFEDLGC